MHQRGWLLSGAYLAALFTMASTTAIPASQLFSRQALTCPAKYAKCPDFPDNFCCPTGNACISLAGGTTLLCCPPGSGCARIKTISCDLDLQDASKKPEAPIKTTVFIVDLPKCGSMCCPFGYTCDKDECVKDKDQKRKPEPPSTTAPSPSATSTSIPNPTGTTSPAVTNSAEPTPTSGLAAGESGNVDSNQSISGPSAAVIGGIVAGAVAAVVFAVAVACILVRRRKKNKEDMAPSLKVTRSSSSFGNIISNPIIVEGNPMRTDFNRRATRSFDGSTLDGGALNRKSIGSAGSGSSRGRNLTGNGTLRQSSVAYGFSAGELQNPQPPRTPRQGDQGDREPSSVSINVFADPLALTPESATHGARRKRNSDMTTFTQLMDEADLGPVARGQPYVPYRPSTAGDSPGRNPPRRV